MQQLNLNAPLTIISGGQTGADIAGLVAGRACGLPTTGWAPKGWRTENGSQPLLGSTFNLLEHTSSGYEKRTADNAAASDVTLIFSTNPNSAGTKLTQKECLNADKGFIVISDFGKQSQADTLTYLRLMEPSVINIAGNRESVSPGISARVKQFLVAILPLYNHDLITYIREDGAKHHEINHGPKSSEKK